MDTEQVSERIELLVDRLRADKAAPTTLSDVASVTEVLLTIMRRYFNSIDVSIYGELRHLYEHIQDARQEILHLRPNDLKQEKIPRAGAELEAIVQATEEATGTIMDAAEEIMSADSSDAEAYATTVNDACMRIFEACSFQDITGQRITKVVDTLTHIEDRLNGLQKAWGSEDGEPPVDSDGATDDDEAGLLNGPALAGEGVDQDAVDLMFAGDDEAGLLNGPALAGEGVDQDAVDSMFDGATADAEASNDDVPGDSEPEPEPKAAADAPAAAADASAPEPAPEPAAKAKPAEPAKAPAKKPAAKPAAKKPAPAPAAAAELAASADDGISQADIDALFD